MRIYVFLWILVTSLVGFEYWALDHNTKLSILHHLQKTSLLSPTVKLSTVPGRFLSWWLGWVGFSLMVIMNVYSLRKRIHGLQNVGRLSAWLNFHIFCGILGPTLILFHCGLKVRGLVGISFWSMVISFSSGLIGKYLFLQVSSRKGELDKASESYLKKLDQVLEKAAIIVEENKREKVLQYSIHFFGGSVGESYVNPISALMGAWYGDIRNLFSSLPIPSKWPRKTRYILTKYALTRRRAQFLDSFERLLGYWHAFHFPFAVFMYIAAIVHIISSLVFLQAV